MHTHLKLHSALNQRTQAYEFLYFESLYLLMCLFISIKTKLYHTYIYEAQSNPTKIDLSINSINLFLSFIYSFLSIPIFFHD